MEQSLQLHIGQHLTLTPQLQQAIRLLQLSTIDLQKEIQEILESNPMIEAGSNEEKNELQSNLLEQNHDEFPEFQWSQHSNTNKNHQFSDQEHNFDNLYCTTSNLQDHFHWQLNLSPMSDLDRIIATTLIDAMNDDGFLTSSLAELHLGLTSQNCPIDLDEIRAVQHRLQLFDPIGCACFSLQETLLVQLEQLSLDIKHLAMAKNIILNNIELLGQHNYRQLMKIYQISERTVEEILLIIHKLNPKPGSIIHQALTQYIIPDVTVKKIENQWKVKLNHSTLPHLSINNQYAALIQRTDNNQDAQYLKNNLQEARWFLKSIQSRQDTLLKVARCIVEYQQDFLEHGDEAMKPLVLSDIAYSLDMHESTVSRVTTQKFMHTPRGVFELKYFFSSHVSTNAGGECSSIAIRALIKKLIASENRKKPLSDSKIALLIDKQGIKIARRTVAKYRESIGIAPSNERKTINV